MESGASYNDMANVKDKEGWTPLHRACQQPPPKEKNTNQKGNFSVKYYGTDVEIYTAHILGRKYISAKLSDLKGEEEDAEILNVEEEDKKRATIVELLLTKGGVDPNITDSRGNHMAIHLCAMNGYASVASVILSHSQSAEVDPVNKIT